ncbi:MAG: hypothetical protein ACKOW5_14560, partial [Actinomycetales bacterium]
MQSRAPRTRPGSEQVKGRSGSSRSGPAPARRSIPDGPRAPTPIALVDGGRRIVVMLVSTAVVLGAFAVRLVDLQAVRGAELADQALDQRLRTVTIAAQRGSILDASGEPMAV